MVKNDIATQNLSQNQDGTTEHLRATGRWAERLLPVGNGTKHIIGATLYGIAGATGNQGDYEENERFIMAALVRMAQMGDVPYFIATDPSKSEAIQKAREAQIACDVVSDAFGGSPPPTFCRSGVYEAMKGCGISSTS